MLKRLRNHISCNRYFYTILVISVIIRLVYIFGFTNYNQYLESDAGGYDVRAMEMLFGQHISYSTYWAPFFHLCLMVLYYPLMLIDKLGYRVAVLIVEMALLNLVTLFSVYKIAFKVYGKTAAKVAITLTAIWYPLIYLNIFVLSENIFIPLLYLSLYLVICRGRSSRMAVLTGIVLGLAAIARPILLVFLPFLVIWMLVAKYPRTYVAVITGAVLIVVGLQSTFNYIYTSGETNFISTGGGFNFAMQWCDLKSIQYDVNGSGFIFGPPANINYSDFTRMVTNVPFENQAYYYDIGFQCIKADPKIILKNVEKLWNIFDSNLFPRFYSITGVETLRTIFAVADLILFAVFIVIINMARNLKRESRMIIYLFGLLLLSLFISCYLQNPGEERYLYPYIPAMLVVVSGLISTTYRAIAKRKNRFFSKPIV